MLLLVALPTSRTLDGLPDMRRLFGRFRAAHRSNMRQQSTADLRETERAADGHAAHRKFVHAGHEVRHRPAEAIEPGHDERVARPECVEACREAVAIGISAGEDVLEDLGAPGGSEGAALLQGFRIPSERDRF